MLNNGLPNLLNTESRFSDLTFDQLFLYYDMKGIKLNKKTFKTNLELLTKDGKYNMLAQLFGTLNQKTYSDYRWIEKRKVFLPVGWIAEGGKYIGLLVSGKRKTQGTSAMLKEASKRKDIYSKMKLFEVK